MAIDKAIDSTQLNSDLTSVANAIRTKGGTSASLAFPAGFVSAIEAIPTGGGGDTPNAITAVKESYCTTPVTMPQNSKVIIDCFIPDVNLFDSGIPLFDWDLNKTLIKRTASDICYHYNANDWYTRVSADGRVITSLQIEPNTGTGVFTVGFADGTSNFSSSNNFLTRTTNLRMVLRPYLWVFRIRQVNEGDVLVHDLTPTVQSEVVGLIDAVDGVFYGYTNSDVRMDTVGGSDAWVNATLTSYVCNSSVVMKNAFRSSRLSNIVFDNPVGIIDDAAFQDTLVKAINVNVAVQIKSSAFSSCRMMETIVIQGGASTSASLCYNCTSLTAADLDVSKIDSSAFGNASVMGTLILRSNEITTLGNVNSFNNTPFNSGGTGGTIYIPKVLYDHLGDGTSNDYKAATNWSTMDGYGTITWAKIEGSQYENYYVDGTLIE